MTNPLVRVWNGEDFKLCILEFCWKEREKKKDMLEACSALPDITAFIFIITLYISKKCVSKVNLQERNSKNCTEKCMFTKEI